MILQRTIDTYVGMYDFGVTGGAIGSYDLQVPIIANCIAVEFGVLALVNAAGGAGATISFDYILQSFSPPIPILGLLFPATLATFFVGTVIGYGVSPAANLISPNVQSFDLGAVAPGTGSPGSVGISIGTAPLTAGKLVFFLRVIQLDVTP